jgi:hypothetical protein
MRPPHMPPTACPPPRASFALRRIAFRAAGVPLPAPIRRRPRSRGHDPRAHPPGQTRTRRSSSFHRPDPAAHPPLHLAGLSCAFPPPDALISSP